MEHNISLNKLEENLAIFRSMYDLVRTVDPIRKKVIEYGHSSYKETDNVCYDYWKKGKICDNCISVRAHLEKKSFIKLEQAGDTIMVVTAIPIECSKEPVIIELLKNATNSMLISTGRYPQGLHIENIINDFNDLISKDDMTGLYNRRYINERLPSDIYKAALNHLPLSVIFMDIDNLKEINDTFGHIYGDKTIIEVTDLIPNYINKDSDWVARYGGDEFFICLNNTTSEKAFEVADKIRSKIEDLRIAINGKSICTTASLGVYTIPGYSTLTAEEVIALADNRMFEAKKSGKNSTVGFNKYD